MHPVAFTNALTDYRAGFADGTVPSHGAEAAEARVIMCEVLADLGAWRARVGFVPIPMRWTPEVEQVARRTAFRHCPGCARAALAASDIR